MPMPGPVPMPPIAEQQAISATLDGVDEQVCQAWAERHALHSLKESAGDALLTGRGRVREVQGGKIYDTTNR